MHRLNSSRRFDDQHAVYFGRHAYRFGHPYSLAVTGHPVPASRIRMDDANQNHAFICEHDHHRYHCVIQDLSATRSFSGFEDKRGTMGQERAVGSQAFEFDHTDRRIVALLKENGRVSNQEIASRLDLTRAVVGLRIQRMTEMNALRIVAAADFTAYNYNVLIMLAIKVVGRQVSAVASDLARLDEMFAVHVVSGAHQIEALVAVHDLDELSSSAMPSIMSVAGIGQIDVAIATDIVTYNFDVGISR